MMRLKAAKKPVREKNEHATLEGTEILLGAMLDRAIAISARALRRYTCDSGCGIDFALRYVFFIFSFKPIARYYFWIDFLFHRNQYTKIFYSNKLSTVLHRVAHLLYCRLLTMVHVVAMAAEKMEKQKKTSHHVTHIYCYF